MTEVPTSRRRWRPGPILAAYAYWIVQLRWVVLGFWAVAVGASVLLLPQSCASYRSPARRTPACR